MATRTEPNLVTMICPNLACRRAVSAPESARGMTVRCAYCQTPFRVPMSGGTPPQGEPERVDAAAAPAGKKK
ncbi:MAG: hypothetical protein IT450_14285 [Phycisphaerales bacterium]|nr:hypothetical protein [Phycisphaerales bacterium]